MEETNEKKKGFAKFSELNDMKMKINEPNDNEECICDDVIPANHNVPTDITKTTDTITDDSIKPTVETIGKIAKFPKNTKASKAYNFLENMKVSKRSLWYMMIEKMDNELQMIKFNVSEGVDLTKFVSDLKQYYLTKYKDNLSVTEAISKIDIEGNNLYSKIYNIPLVDIEGKKLLTIITEDLIVLLSK